MLKNIIAVGILAALLGGCSENERLRLVAQNGNADAAFELSQRYAEGRNGLTKSPEESLQWLRIAAENGNAAAQVLIGQILMPLKAFSQFSACPDAYDKEQYGKERIESARKWYKKAALQDDFSGGQLLVLSDLVLLDKYFKSGAKNRVEEIQKEVEYWGAWCWEKALAAGNNQLAASLATGLADGCLLSDGGSAEKEFLWRSRAAETGNAEAQFKLAQMYFKRSESVV